MIDRATAARLQRQLTELGERVFTRESARAVRSFTKSYSGIDTLPHSGDFRIPGQPGAVSLREALKREARERAERLRASRDLAHMLDADFQGLAMIGKKDYDAGRVGDRQIEDYREALDHFAKVFDAAKPYSRYIAAGAVGGRIAPGHLAEVARLLRRCVEIHGAEHARRTAESGRDDGGRQAVRAFERGMEQKPEMGMTATADQDDHDVQKTGADHKVSKELTNYRYASDPERSCGKCVHYREPNQCNLVMGLIRPEDTCDKFEPEPKENRR